MPKKTEQEWQQQLTPEQFRVARMKGTEAPFSGEYDQCFEAGEYHCICCGEVLFESNDKFDAGCGWPSFTKPAELDKLIEENDESIPGSSRTEVMCQHCGAHLGHVFPDGPPETGFRYCINSVSLKFETKDE